MFGLKEFCFLDKHLVIKRFLVEKNLDLEMILVIDFLHLFQILPLGQSDKWRMSNPANERSVTHQVKVHWSLLLF